MLKTLVRNLCGSIMMLRCGKGGDMCAFVAGLESSRTWHEEESAFWYDLTAPG